MTFWPILVHPLDIFAITNMPWSLSFHLFSYTNFLLMKFSGFFPAFSGNKKQSSGLCFPFFPQWGHSGRSLPFLRPRKRPMPPPAPTPPVPPPPMPPPLLPVHAFAAAVAAANTFAISFFISVISCWQKLFIVFVASVLRGVLLADLVVTANANSRSIMRHANVSLRTEMYVSLSLLSQRC
jgi:hypothetical protein